jgi:hypothetical protein
MSFSRLSPWYHFNNLSLEIIYARWEELRPFAPNFHIAPTRLQATLSFDLLSLCLYTTDSLTHAEGQDEDRGQGSQPRRIAH